MVAQWAFEISKHMELFCSSRWRLYRPKRWAIVFISTPAPPKIFAPLARHHSIHVWLLGRSRRSAPSTKELHARPIVIISSRIFLEEFLNWNEACNKIIVLTEAFIFKTKIVFRNIFDWTSVESFPFSECRNLLKIFYEVYNVLCNTVKASCYIHQWRFGTFTFQLILISGMNCFLNGPNPASFCLF